MGKYDAHKAKVLDVARTLSARGYFGTHSGSAGNVSMLVDGEDTVVVTPSSLPYTEMTADDICVVDLKQRKLEGAREPSIETPLHIAVYENRRDVNAVIHTHQIYASALSVLNLPIPALFDEATVAIGNVVEVVPYALSGSQELIENVVAKLSNRCHCYILQNHGALCVGKNLDKTFTYVELLEKVSMIYYRALATGREITQLPEPLPTALFSMVTASQDMEIARKDRLKAEG